MKWRQGILDQSPSGQPACAMSESLKGSLNISSRFLTQISFDGIPWFEEAWGLHSMNSRDLVIHERS